MAEEFNLSEKRERMLIDLIEKFSAKYGIGIIKQIVQQANDLDKEFIKRLKQILIERDPKILCSISHKNSCGKPIRDNQGHITIECGGDLGGDNNEFAQCHDCRIEDFIDKLAGDKLIK